MAKFDRPKNAINDVRDLKAGDVIWHLYGIWPPQLGGEYIVTLPATKFADHREFSDIHASSGDDIVFDAHWKEASNPWMQFASDGNLLPGYSHNDNYWFRSEEDAKAAEIFLRAEWEKQPDKIAQALEDRHSLFEDEYYGEDA